MPDDLGPVEEQRRRRRYERERAARLEAEAIAERVTLELYSAGQALTLANVKLEEGNRVLERANDSIKEFVAIASHDMRNPLTSILGYSGMLIDRWSDWSDERKLEFLGIIRKQGLSLSRLVDDLLTVSKIEAGAIETHLEQVYVRNAFQRIVDDLGDPTDAISIQVSEDLRVEVDPDHLERILVNYLSNAVKYGAAPILAEAEICDEWVRIAVRDGGAGVPAAFVPRLFEKFARSGGADSVGIEGTGLGLSIVMGLAKANGGDAWYEPNESKGSCFGVTLRRSLGAA